MYFLSFKISYRRSITFPELLSLLIAFDLNNAVTEQDGFDEEHSTSLNALYYEEHIKFILRIYSKHGNGMANNMLLQPQLNSRELIFYSAGYK